MTLQVSKPSLKIITSYPSKLDYSVYRLCLEAGGADLLVLVALPATDGGAGFEVEIVFCKLIDSTISN